MVPRASKQQVHRLELDGNPTLATIERLAAALVVDAVAGLRGNPERSWQSEPIETGVYWIRQRQSEGRPLLAAPPQYLPIGVPWLGRLQTSPWYFAPSCRRWAAFDGRQVCPVDGPPRNQEKHHEAEDLQTHYEPRLLTNRSIWGRCLNVASVRW